MKHCPRCGETKSLFEFSKATKSPDGHQGYCKPCVREDGRARAAQRPRVYRQRKSAPTGYKHCADCDTHKPLTDFPRNKRTADGHAQYCKICHNARGVESRERLHGGNRHYHLMRRYGIGAAEVDAMIEAQGGLCAICRERKPEHVDHDHETGKNRGITCSCCNQGLGNFRDRIDLLELAADYLAEHDPNAAARRTEAVTRLAGLDLPASIEAERRQIRDRANGDLGQAT